LPHIDGALEILRQLINAASRAKEETSMKSLLSLMVIGSTVALVAPAFADPKPPTTKEECDKTEGYDWDAAAGKCIAETPGG